MEWDRESMLTLINLFKAKEVLWNPKIDDYKNRHKRHTALHEIACVFSTSPTEVERKIKNLSCQYFREKNKVDESTKSCSDKDEIYKSKWFAYNLLNFLGNRRDQKQIIRKKKLKEKFTDSKHDNSPTHVLHNPPDDNSSDSQETESYPTNPFISEFLRVMRNMPQRYDKDEDDLFGDYIAGQLRKMDKSLKAVVRNRINNIIFEVESGCALSNTISNSNSLYGHVHSQPMNAHNNCSPTNAAAKVDQAGDRCVGLVEFSLKTEPHGSH